jgi:lipoprotein-anchoring transpeptidase ErfK/SrfK
MNLYKIIPLIGSMLVGCYAENVDTNATTTAQEEQVPITVYTLFVKNPSYQKLAENINKIDITQANVPEVLASVAKEPFKFKKIEKKKKEKLLAKKEKKVSKKEKIALKKSESKSTKSVVSSKNSKSYQAFVRSPSYPKTFAVYKDEKLIKLARKYGSEIIVDRRTQRIKLVVNGKVAIDSPCTTGSPRKIEPHTKEIRNKETPKGVFRIQEKIADKRSTIFGKLYRYGKVVFKGDRRKYKGPPARYEGASLKNWMRLTSSGIGIHGSHYIKRHPASNGCIRVPYSVVGKIFSAVKTGTKVIVR